MSEEAIDVARGNAHCCDLDVHFGVVDLFSASLPSQPFDMVMSNPPFSLIVKASMQARVTRMTWLASLCRTT